MDFKILKIRIIDKGKLVAEVVCKYGQLVEVRGFLVFKNDNDFWVSWPSQSWVGNDGQRRWEQIVKPSNELQRAIDALIVQAVKDQLREEAKSDETPF